MNECTCIEGCYDPFCKYDEVSCLVCGETVDDNVIRHGYIGANDSHRVVRTGDRP